MIISIHVYLFFNKKTKIKDSITVMHCLFQSITALTCFLKASSFNSGKMEGTTKIQTLVHPRSPYKLQQMAKV